MYINLYTDSWVYVFSVIKKLERFLNFIVKPFPCLFTGFLSDICNFTLINISNFYEL